MGNRVTSIDRSPQWIRKWVSLTLLLLRLAVIQIVLFVYDSLKGHDKITMKMIKCEYCTRFVHSEIGFKRFGKCRGMKSNSAHIIGHYIPRISIFFGLASQYVTAKHQKVENT